MKITKCQKNKIRKIAKKYGIKLMVAFGSFVTGILHDKSDIDIAVLPRNKFNYKKFFSLAAELSEVFTDREIDMSLINHANPLLLYKICSNPVLLYGNNRILNNLKIYSFNRYVDYHPYFLIEKKFVKNFINGQMSGNKYAGR